MSFFMWTAGLPLLLLAAAGVAAVVFHPSGEIAGALAAVAMLWLLFTGKARKVYWSARLRARAAHDERRSRA